MHRQGALAHLAVRGDVAQVVDHEQRAGQAPGKAAGEPGNRGEALAHHVRGAGGGHQPEEHEHEHLTEAEVAIRLGPTGVPPPGEHRRSPDHEQPPAGDRREQQPGHGRDAESCKCCSLHRAGRSEATRNQPHRTHPHFVGTAHAVAVVVGVVHTDLQGKADDQGRGHSPPDGIGLADGRSGTERHRHHRRGKGSWTGAEQPTVHSRHSRLVSPPCHIWSRSICPVASSS